MNDLIKNIGKVHASKIGLERAMRVPDLKDVDANVYLRERILQADRMERNGENWYAYADNHIFIVDANTYEVISAKYIKATCITTIYFNDASKNVYAELSPDDLEYLAKRFAKRIYRDCMRDIAEEKQKQRECQNVKTTEE
ncbi:MAG: DUF3781 domain-containing protein [Firmicutes bacterium]|nr:DUF3781 domain-containing protein [Bacillota bacterium]